MSFQAKIYIKVNYFFIFSSTDLFWGCSSSFDIQSKKESPTLHYTDSICSSNQACMWFSFGKKII